jgi:hypothetical protein
MGRIGGGAIEAVVRGRTVLIAWGDGSLKSALDAAEHPERSVKTWLRADPNGRGEELPNRFALVWPGRMRLPLKGLDSATPLSRSLAEGSPIVWSGWDRAEGAFDRVLWSDLRPLVHRFLAEIPLEPRKAR